MDGRHFDAMTRALADDRSRRSVIRGLFGVAAAGILTGVRGRGAIAQGALPPGATCREASQCSQDDGPVDCADNGYPGDGELNCCRNEGGVCGDETFSADCCSGLYCRDGACTDLSVSGDLPLGSFCTESGQCSQDGGPVVCAGNDLVSDGALNCCREAGGACDESAGCCGGSTCEEGVCAGEITEATSETPAGTPTATADDAAEEDDSSEGDGSAAGSGLSLGAVCAATAECAPADNGDVFCAANGIGIDGALNCCLGLGGACGTTSSLCCGTNVCFDGVCGG